jgi:hypothetical protein
MHYPHPRSPRRICCRLPLPANPREKIVARMALLP